MGRCRFAVTGHGHGVSDAWASRLQFDKALEALEPGDTLVITTLDRLGRSTANMLELSKENRCWSLQNMAHCSKSTRG